ncbi:hypothetical protein BZZ01_13705 [Nostocales cyanobacterium HT-58-2]|nr:hypothetical protein BZZ01_13705 [Nostocales cyanobacterium HT-58-2]
MLSIILDPFQTLAGDAETTILKLGKKYKKLVSKYSHCSESSAAITSYTVFSHCSLVKGLDKNA